jgi:hypothetical protein
MKNTLKRFGFIAVTAVIGLTMMSCPQEQEEQGASLPSSLKIADAPAFPSGASLANRTEAHELYSAAGQSNLATILNEEYEKAFNATFGKTLEQFALENAASSNPKVDVSIDKSVKIDNTDSDATIKGKSTAEMKFTGGMVLGDFTTRQQGNDPTVQLLSENGEGYTAKSDLKMTFTFPFIEVTSTRSAYYNEKFKVAGIITVEDKGSRTRTLKDKTDKVYTSKNSSETKYSLVLTIVRVSDNKAAKFRMSYATSGSGNTDAKKGSKDAFSAYSDLEVYNSGNELQYTETSSLYVAFDDASTLINKIKWNFGI